MRPGVRIALDIGDARIGVASSDPHGILATPVETVRRGPGDLDRIAAITAELEAVEIVAWELAVRTPVPAATLYSETWLESRSTTKRNFPEGATTMFVGPSPAGKGEPVMGARMPSGALGSLQLVTI